MMSPKTLTYVLTVSLTFTLKSGAALRKNTSYPLSVSHSPLTALLAHGVLLVLAVLWAVYWGGLLAFVALLRPLTAGFLSYEA